MIYLVSKQQRIPNPEITPITVEESLKLLEPLDIVGLDTETKGIDPWTKELLSVQLGCYDFQVVIDCTTIDISLYKNYLESNRLFTGWNLKFDAKFLFKQGIVLNNVYDGYLAEKLMWLGYPAGIHSLSLKAAGKNYLDIELDKSVRGKIIWAGLIDEVVIYSALDVKYLNSIRDKQLEVLEEKGLTKAIAYENKFVLPLAYCEFCGIKLDKDKWKAKMAKDQSRVDNALAKLNEWLLKNEPDSKYIKVDNQGDLFSGFDLTPKVTLNWNSSTQVADILKKHGVNVTVFDKDRGTFKDSVDSKVLSPQKDKCDLIPIYLDYKEAVKVTSTYGENFLEQINPVSGRIHTNYQQMGADTTRITSGGKDKENNTEYVNLLNLPSDAETRACFVAEEGNKWISIDYSGQETFLMASIANDEAIIEELTNGSGDMHSLVAKMVFKDEIGNTPVSEIKHKYHSLRQLAKGYEFLFNYGGTAQTIVNNYGKSIKEANQIYDNYMSGFKGLKAYQDFRRKDWFDKGYILLNPRTGHKSYIFDYNELKELKASFTSEFWDIYRQIPINPITGKKVPRNAEEMTMCENVTRFSRRKATLEKQSINYPIQATGSMCLRVALIYFFSYLREHNLLFRVKLCVTPYDEINCEAPEAIAEEIATTLYNCMVKAGAYFCTRCKLDADISRDDNGKLPIYWIH